MYEYAGQIQIPYEAPVSSGMLFGIWKFGLYLERSETTVQDRQNVTHRPGSKHIDLAETCS